MITQIAIALTALVGLAVLVWTQYLSPKAKSRNAALKAASKAIDNGDVSEITAMADKLRHK